jgi:hypothetical protein
LTHPPPALLDAAFSGAIAAAAALVAWEPGDRSFLEKRLAASVGSALASELPRNEIVLNKKLVGFQLPGWAPQPGAFDLAVKGEHGQPIAVAEIKLDDVDQSLWDLFKVASALDAAPVQAAYLIVAAPTATWAGELDMVELFNAGAEAEEWYSRFLFDAHRHAWERLLTGGRARPLRVPRVLFITPIATAPVRNFPPYEVRAVRVTTTDEQLPLIEGWPSRRVDPREIPDDELSIEDIPVGSADEAALHAFALTTNGYERMGSFARCAALANETLERWRQDGRVPGTMRELRCCLFFEQRRWHHYGDAFDDETRRYVADLIGAIRNLVAGPRRVP